jgi:hypothetical protein
METAVLVLAILAAVLVMACGVWVAVVLIATVPRAKRAVESGPGNPASGKPRP